jgi:hypothetical protein
MALKTATDKNTSDEKFDQSPRWDSNFDGRDQSDKCLPLRY